MTVLATTPNLQTSPIFSFRGERSRWRYPDRRLDPETSFKLRNLNLSERGSADRRKGYTKYNSTQLSGSEAGTGLYQANFNSTGIQQVETTATKVYADNGTTRKDITGSLSFSGTDDDRTRFVFFQDQVVGTNNVDQTWVWAGDYATPTAATTHSGGANVPFTTCRDFVAHRGVLLALNTVEGGTRYPAYT